MKHPRANELPKLVAALEKAGRPVAAVEVRWDTDADGKDAQVWRIVFGEAVKAHQEEAVKW